MPTSDEILAGLTEISNRAIEVAIAWHVIVGLVIVALASGWRPSRRTAGTLVAVPLVSVAAFAFAFANPFNGVVFALGAIALVALALLDRSRPQMRRGRPLLSAFGIASIAFGWFYPHFLVAPPSAYFFSAPLGLVPCPTLAVAIGFALLGGGFGRAWSLTLAGLGLFYGLFGVLRLGVVLDAGLVVAAGVLVGATLGSNLTVRRPAPAVAIR